MEHGIIKLLSFTIILQILLGEIKQTWFSILSFGLRITASSGSYTVKPVLKMRNQA